MEKFIFCAVGVDNFIKKANELLTVLPSDYPDIVCLTETLLKHTANQWVWTSARRLWLFLKYWRFKLTQMVLLPIWKSIWKQEVSVSMKKILREYSCWNVLCACRPQNSCVKINILLVWPKAVLQWCSNEKVFWKCAANLQENTHVELWF